MEEKFGFDTKHGAHLYRLIVEGEELLTKGYITFPRPDAKLLLEIRYGKWSYEKLLEKVQNFEERFEFLYSHSILPTRPNAKKINNLCIEINKNYLKGEE